MPVDDLESWLGDDTSEPFSETDQRTPWRWQVTTGLEYSEGDYGSSEHADAWVQSVSARIGKGDWTFGLNGSYQWITGPAFNPLIFDDVALFFADDAALDSLFIQQSDQGIGDLRVSAHYAPAGDVFDGWYPSIALKVKLPTAGDALGTGKIDVTLTADVAKIYGDWSVFALASHTVRGDTPEFRRRNTFAGSLGTDYRFSSSWSAGLSYDLRETSTLGGGAASSVFAYGRYRLNDTVSLLGYGALGLDDNGPDNVIGLRLSLKGLW